MNFKSFLVERPPLPASTDGRDKLTRIGGELDILDGNRTLTDGIMAMGMWFSGEFMGGDNKDALPIAQKLFEIIGKVYKPAAIPDTLYRACKIHIPDHIKDQASLKKIKKIQTGLSKLQSWSSKKDGTDWYFKKFVHQQNHSDQVNMDGRAWIVVESETPKVIIDFAGAIQFLSDMYDLGYVKGKDRTSVLKMIDCYNDENMDKSYEVICVVPTIVPIKIVEILKFDE